MRAAYLLSPSFILRERMGASKAALVLMKNSQFDRTLQYLVLKCNPSEIRICFKNFKVRIQIRTFVCETKS